MNMPESFSVLLVDDHPILRQGLKQLLMTDPHVTICGEAENGEEAVLKALSLKPDVILMDINLPKVNGYEASRAILATWPAARILVFTNQDDIGVIKKFLDIGVKGCLLKDIPLEELIAAMQAVHRGEDAQISAEFNEKLANQKNTASPFTLTDREREVLSALSKGYSNQQLADLLCVSPKTVHNHLYNIYSKIGVTSRAEAIVWALSNNN